MPPRGRTQQRLRAAFRSSLCGETNVFCFQGAGLALPEFARCCPSWRALAAGHRSLLARADGPCLHQVEALLPHALSLAISHGHEECVRWVVDETRASRRRGAIHSEDGEAVEEEGAVPESVALYLWRYPATLPCLLAEAMRRGWMDWIGPWVEEFRSDAMVGDCELGMANLLLPAALLAGDAALVRRYGTEEMRQLHQQRARGSGKKSERGQLNCSLFSFVRSTEALCALHDLGVAPVGNLAATCVLRIANDNCVELLEYYADGRAGEEFQNAALQCWGAVVHEAARGGVTDVLVWLRARASKSEGSQQQARLPTDLDNALRAALPALQLNTVRWLHEDCNVTLSPPMAAEGYLSRAMAQPFSAGGLSATTAYALQHRLLDLQATDIVIVATTSDTQIAWCAIFEQTLACLARWAPKNMWDAAVAAVGDDAEARERLARAAEAEALRKSRGLP